MMSEIRASIFDGTFASYRAAKREAWAGTDEDTPVRVKRRRLSSSPECETIQHDVETTSLPS
jgi:hypothetical protein